MFFRNFKNFKPLVIFLLIFKVFLLLMRHKKPPSSCCDVIFEEHNMELQENDYSILLKAPVKLAPTFSGPTNQTVYLQGLVMYPSVPLFVLSVPSPFPKIWAYAIGKYPNLLKLENTGKIVYLWGLVICTRVYHFLF